MESEAATSTRIRSEDGERQEEWGIARQYPARDLRRSPEALKRGYLDLLVRSVLTGTDSRQEALAIMDQSATVRMVELWMAFAIGLSCEIAVCREKYGHPVRWSFESEAN